jgi:hypothetical protein
LPFVLGQLQNGMSLKSLVLAPAGSGTVEPLDQMSGNYLFDLDLDGTIGRGDGRVIKMNKLHTVP